MGTYNKPPPRTYGLLIFEVLALVAFYFLLAGLLVDTITGDVAYRQLVIQCLWVGVARMLLLWSRHAYQNGLLAAAAVHADTVRTKLLHTYAHPAYRLTDPASSTLRTMDTVAKLTAAYPTYLAAAGRVRIVCPLLLLVVGGMNLTCAVILLLTAPFLPVFMILIGKGSRDRWQDHLRRAGDLGAYFTERVAGLATLRRYAAVVATGRRLGERAVQQEKALGGVMQLAFLTQAVVTFFASAGLALIAIYLGLSLLGYLHFGAWPFAIDFRLALTILFLVPEFFRPLGELADFYHEERAARAAADLLAAAEGFDFPPEGNNDLEVAGALSCSALTFGYPESGRQLLDSFDLRVTPGEWIGIMGPSGCGKTTLLKLLTGLLPTPPGTVSRGGRIAYVNQEDGLLDASLAENLGPGGSGHYPQLPRLAAGLPQGYATPIGAGGVQVSGGQARSIVLARALASDHPILVLDEPFAHLDAERARLLYAELIERRGNRTIIQVSHDLRWLADADRIITIAE